MLLESIKLENFRQFRNESIDFAQGNDGKNVTIILGENGTGKTTFAQAFFWCLYGETEFSDKNMLNKIVATELRAGQNANVQVTLKLKHGEVCYTITREQKYHKDSANKIKSDNVVFDIAIKDQNGNTSYVKTTQCDSEIQKILPKELSRYFFFDGERIEKMGKDISNDRRAVDFADAVKGLLGLNAMDAAIKHFNPKSKYGVIGSYESSFDSKNNTKILEYTKKIDQYKTECEEIDAQIEELDRQISMAHTQKTHKSEEIKMYEDGAKLQQEKERLEQKILNEKKAKSASYKEICKTFNSHLSSFFSISLIRRALDIIAQGDFSGKDIPYMHSKTIEYLLKQKICICGTHLDEGSVPYQNVAELIQYLPPQSISTTIADFKKESRRRSDAMQDTFALIKERLEIVSHYDDQINDWRDDLQKIEAKLSGGDVREKVRIINNAIRLCDETIRKCSIQRDQKHQRRGSLQSQIERTQTERSNLTLLDEKNKKIEMYKLCAERIYQELKESYEENEAEIRKRLEKTINDIFVQIYEGGLYLTIDEKYRISVTATDYDGYVETSTAQSISVIFAFITAIIQMAKENKMSTDDNAMLLSSEPYPLVMDAPLSAFDKRRIKTVCEALPRTAEQVIIFIKDTDGELAEDYMGSKIGSRHSFDKKNEFETVLL